MTDIKIIEATEPVYKHYPSQTHAQDCYIELDTEACTVSADYNPEIGNAIPRYVAYGVGRRYAIPSMQAETANKLMHDLMPLFVRVVEGTEVVWGHGNNVAVLNDDAQAAELEIEHNLPTESDFHVWDAADWLCMVKSEVKSEIRVGRSLDALYEDYQGDGSNEDTPYVEGLWPYLEHLAAEVSEEPGEEEA